LALVPLVTLGWLPSGNTGRATVNSFRPLPLEPAMQQLIGQARRAIVTEDAQKQEGTRPSLRRDRGNGSELLDGGTIA